MSKKKSTFVPLMLRLPEELHAQIKSAAKENRRSLNSQCIFMLEQSIRESETKLLQPSESA